MAIDDELLHSAKEDQESICNEEAYGHENTIDGAAKEFLLTATVIVYCFLIEAKHEPDLNGVEKEKLEDLNLLVASELVLEDMTRDTIDYHY